MDPFLKLLFTISFRYVAVFPCLLIYCDIILCECKIKYCIRRY